MSPTFIGFGEDDIAAIHGSAAHLAPIVPQLVDAVYEKLFLYDATRRHFVPRQSGYEGDVPENVEALLMNHEMIEVHKLHPGRYLERLVTKPYDGNMLNDLDLAGKMHTPKSGSKELDIPLVQMNALMGFMSDALIDTILSLDLDAETTSRTLRAFNKLL